MAQQKTTHSCLECFHVANFWANGYSIFTTMRIYQANNALSTHNHLQIMNTLPNSKWELLTVIFIVLSPQTNIDRSRIDSVNQSLNNQSTSIANQWDYKYDLCIHFVSETLWSLWIIHYRTYWNHYTYSQTFSQLIWRKLSQNATHCCFSLALYHWRRTATFCWWSSRVQQSSRRLLRQTILWNLKNWSS